MCYKKETSFFFFLHPLEASPFHPRAITSTHIKPDSGEREEEGGREASSFWAPLETDRLPGRQELCWGCKDDTGLSRQQEICSHEVKVTWHFKKWQQELVFGQ